MRDRPQRILALIICLVFATTTCCTGMVTVPATDYEKLKSEESSIWIVTTSEGTSFSVSQFTMTDTTLVIEALVSAKYDHGEISDERFPKSRDLPMSLDRSDIVAIEQEKTEILAPAVIIILGGVLVLGIAAWIYLANSGPLFGT
jgi:hypothetical protein